MKYGKHRAKELMNEMKEELYVCRRSGRVYSSQDIPGTNFAGMDIVYRYWRGKQERFRIVIVPYNDLEDTPPRFSAYKGSVK